jgi:uncharacterized surface protein with fasciclin (FAS1) repeats
MWRYAHTPKTLVSNKAKATDQSRPITPASGGEPVLQHQRIRNTNQHGWLILWGDRMKIASRMTAAAVIALTLGAGAARAENIVEIAAADERFTTLVAAVTAAGLAETLSGPGPFTVFAPVNDAFAALPAGTVDTLLKPENKGQLTDILLYHVDDRNLSAAAIPNGSNYFKPLLTSQRLCISKGADGVKIADGSGDVATVIIADIVADNGVIHVIDKVLLPGKRPACH